MSQSKKPVAQKKLKKEATSKEQKAQEAEVMRQRTLVKDVLFPFLCEKTKNTVEAKRLCYEVQQVLNQSFQKIMAEEQKKISDSPTSSLTFEDIINKGKEFAVDKELVALFADEPLSVTNALLGGMSAAIDSFVNEEMSGRHLTSLKTTFL